VERGPRARRHGKPGRHEALAHAARAIASSLHLPEPPDPVREGGSLLALRLPFA